MDFANLTQHQESRVDLQEKLALEFNDPKLFEIAMTHRSMTRHRRGSASVQKVSAAREALRSDNERFEFLGDAVLQLAITDILIKTFPQMSEGSMSKIRSRLVNKSSLAILARSLGIDKALILGVKEEADGGRSKDTILADALEALLGALYLDQGWEVVKTCIAKMIFDGRDDVSPFDTLGEVIDREQDYKSLLQEWNQKVSKETPAYELVAAKGPAHDREFEVVVKVSGQEKGRAKAASKKKAEQLAAECALRNLNITISPWLGENKGPTHEEF